MISIKPLLFTYHFLTFKYYSSHARDNKRAEFHVTRAFTLNPAEYLIHKKGGQITIESLTKYAIRKNDPQILKKLRFPSLSFEDLKSKYKDNFYVQHLLDNIGTDRNWENLDEISFEFLSDPTFNKLTIPILEEIRHTFNPDFIRTLIDFCKWKENVQLTQHLVDIYDIDVTSSEQQTLQAPTNATSIQKLKNIIRLKFNLKKVELESIITQDFEFPDIEDFQNEWIFSDMAGGEIFAEASFLMELDSSRKNKVVRLMGFFIDQKSPKINPRGGMWYQRPVTIKPGVYLFSFDYLTQTGKEIPSFWLREGIEELMLPQPKRQWRKLVFILNNQKGKWNSLKPLIRMWGKGTVLIDNVSLFRWLQPELDRESKNIWIIKKFN